MNNLNDNVSVNRSVNDTRKHNDNVGYPLDKHQIINELKTCNYRTPPKKISLLLEQLFKKYHSKSTHWSYIAQSYTPKTINSVVYRLIKLHNSGYSIKNPAALFTRIIQKRKKRKMNSKYQ